MADRGAGDDSEANDQVRHGGVAFQISIEEDGEERPRSAVPSRLRQYKKRTVTREELHQKQMEAETRRKEKEEEMLQRIHQAQKDVAKLNQNFSILLEADARRQEMQDTSGSSVSRQQLKEAFRAVNTDYKKMVSCINSNTQYSD